MIVGLTGGIGSGKTTVAKLFETLYQIPLYISDVEAKRLMVEDVILIQQIKELLGEESYLSNGTLNKPYIGNKIFNDKALLSQMNALVHPRVAADFNQWATKQNSPYIIKETALLFEIGAHHSCDYVISVIAPIEARIARIASRDHLKEDAIIKKIKNQSSDAYKMELSDFLIYNEDLSELPIQIGNIHNKLLEKIHI